MNSEVPPDPSPSVGLRQFPNIFWFIFAVIAGIMAGGIHLVEEMKDGPLAFPDTRNWFNAFFVTTGSTEPAGLYLVLLFTVSIALWLYSRRTVFRENMEPRKARSAVPLLALFAFIVSAVGVWLVMHNRALAADENMPDFQASIFLSGKFQATIPEKLVPLVRTFKPLQAMISADETKWNQGYLPMYAALRAPFLAVDLQTLVNPLFCAWAVASMAGICRNLWPEKPWLALAGAAFVALSPQILINGMTSYAMPAHLALNLFWLWLYLRPQSAGFWFTPFIGVLAVGLHSPFVHALFAVPFLLRLVVDRRWKASAWFGAIYLAGCVGYHYWWQLFAPSNAAPSSSTFAMFGVGYGLAQGINFLNLFSWSVLPLPLLIGLALWKYRDLPTPLRDGAMSCLLTFCFYATISFDQGLGWGNRYFYGVLGCLILLAVYGLDVLVKTIGKELSFKYVVIGLLATLLFQIPLRSWQVEKFVRPYAVAQEAFQKMNVDLVVYDARMAWYSSELRRNNSTLTNRPLIANLLVLNGDDAETLRKLFPRRRFVTREELAGYGLPTRQWTPPADH